jgi:glycosyltransferase involved in cell wall biosynthesis
VRIPKRPKILFFSEIATPYRQPVLAKLCRSERWDLRVALLAPRQSDRAWNLVDDPVLAERTDVMRGAQFGSLGAHHIFVNWGVRNYLKSQKPDLAVISGYAQPAFHTIRRFCIRNKVPYVTVTESHLKKRRNPLLNRLKRSGVERFYRSAAAHLTMGSASRGFVVSYGANVANVFDFPNTIDVPAYAQAVEECRREREIKRRDRAGFEGQNILYVGALAPWKGVDLLVRAFSSLSRKQAGIALHLVGDGPQRPELERLASSVPRGEIHFHGFNQPANLPRFYAGADVLVLPSRQETWGVVLIEAMAAGLPVISSNAVGAADDLVLDGRTGFVFPTGDVGALEERLGRILADPELKKRLGQGAFETAKSWSHDRAIRGFGRAVETALAKIS